MTENREQRSAGRRQKLFFVLFFCLLSSVFCSLSSATVAIETQVSRSRVAVGDEITLDIIISDADGAISQPSVTSIQGFSSYSQGHSEEISIINGKKSSRSVFSYVLIANSAGTKSIGPFEVRIGNKSYKVAPVQVVVSNEPTIPTVRGSGMPASASPPPSRALPSNEISNQDIFAKAWLDKDEVYVNEPATLTYTLYTRLSATYKGFEKEPETTGFWVEDFPPDKTIKRTEQILNGSRYVVADVRKIALFPTQTGVFTIDPGTLSATVELQGDNNFDTFFSYNIFGRRSSTFPSFMSQVVSKLLPTDKVTLVAKVLPELGRPKDFSGAVGDYRIESSLDKKEAEVGNAVTVRVWVTGEGNINTVEMPKLPPLDDFKIYDSSTSSNISKERLRVEGEKSIETVIVPKKAGTFTIPALSFSYFDPREGVYKGIQTASHTLTVKPSSSNENEPESFISPTGMEPVEKEQVAVLGKDIHYLKIIDDGKTSLTPPLWKRPFYWVLNFLLFIGTACFFFLSKKKVGDHHDVKLLRFRKSHRLAKKKLRSATAMLREDKSDAFYSEIAKAAYGYFADKLGVPSQAVNVELIEERMGQEAVPEFINELKVLFNELGLGRFGSHQVNLEHMKEIYELTDKVITTFEKVKLR